MRGAAIRSAPPARRATGRARDHAEKTAVTEGSRGGLLCVKVPHRLITGAGLLGYRARVTAKKQPAAHVSFSIVCQFQVDLSFAG